MSEPLQQESAPKQDGDLGAHPEALLAKYNVAAPRYTSYPSVPYWKEIELEQVRQQGWSSNLDEWQAGLSVLAAPILSGSHLLGTVAVATVSARLPEIGMEQLTRRVIKAAHDMALRLEGKRQ